MPSNHLASRPNRARGSVGYRYDLDGLRGLAIALVVIFHVWLGRVSGGVDVFLTLSGFFFLGSLLRGAVDPRTSLNPLPHLVRLIRRLYPILVVTIAVTVLGTMLVKPRTQWESIFDQAIASLLYFQNWELAWTSQDYAAADEKISPLQHLWSMSVQGQFYLITLAVVLGVTAVWRLAARQRSPKWLLVALALLGTIGSTWYAAIGHSTNPAWNYYNTAARMWELLVGGLFALLLAGVVLPLALRLITTIIGLALIISCGFLIDGALQFPGPLAWYPIGGALLIVLGGNLPSGERAHPLRDPVHWFLALPLLRKLGDISYSLYLWHWPLLILWLSASGAPRVSLTAGIGIIAISVLLALLTERYIERPLRMPSRAKSARTPAALSRDSGRTRLRTPRQRRELLGATAVVLVAALATVGTMSTWALTSSSRSAVPYVDVAQDPEHPGARALIEGLHVPDDVAYVPNALQVGNDLPQSTIDKCITDFQSDEVNLCVYGDPEAERTVVLAGGSHSEHWVTALDQIGKHYGFRVVTVLKMGCPLTLQAAVSDGTDEPQRTCRSWTPKALSAVVGLAPEYVFTTSTRPATVVGPDATPREYVDFWKALSDKGIGVMAIRDNPWLNRNGPFRASDCLSEGGTPAECGMPREASMSSLDPATIAAAGLPQVKLLDLTDGLCDPVDCPAVVGNVVVYHDSHHLSATWVRSASTEIARQMGVVTGWW